MGVCHCERSGGGPGEGGAVAGDAVGDRGAAFAPLVGERCGAGRDDRERRDVTDDGSLGGRWEGNGRGGGCDGEGGPGAGGVGQRRVRDDDVVGGGVAGLDVGDGEGRTSGAGDVGGIGQVVTAFAPLVGEGGGAVGRDGEHGGGAGDFGEGGWRGGDDGRQAGDDQGGPGARDGADRIGNDDGVDRRVGGLDVGERERGGRGGSVTGNGIVVIEPLIRKRGGGV